MRYATIVIRYDDDEKRITPEYDDELFGGQVTAMAPYDAIFVANTAVNALDDLDVVQTIKGIIGGHK